jgi:hypothetical protein
MGAAAAPKRLHLRLRLRECGCEGRFVILEDSIEGREPRLRCTKLASDVLTLIMTFALIDVFRAFLFFVDTRRSANSRLWSSAKDSK